MKRISLIIHIDVRMSTVSNSKSKFRGDISLVEMIKYISQSKCTPILLTFQSHSTCDIQQHRKGFSFTFHLDQDYKRDVESKQIINANYKEEEI